MFSILIYILIGVGIGFLVWGFVGGSSDEKKEVCLNGEEKREEKILEFLDREGKITNNQIEEMLGVSDTSVGRYLDELERKGKIKQIGKTGKSVYYIKK